MPENEYMYSAFISYRHVTPDREIATELFKVLETYHIPLPVQKKTGIKKLKKLFRDREELPLSSNLGDDIHAALKGSEWLICLCSPDYVDSSWCREEIAYFISLGRRDHILTVLVNGKFETGFPEQLKDKTEDGKPALNEPLAADVTAKTIAESKKLLRTEKLRILAPLLGVKYDDLRRREFQRKMRSTVAASLAVITLTGAFAAYSFNRAQVIEREHRLAAGNEVLLLSEKSIGLTQQEERKQAREYALQAYSVSDTIDGDYREEARSALAAACYNADFTRLYSLESNNISIYDGCYSPDDSLFAAIANYDSISVFDTGSGSLQYTVYSGFSFIDGFSFSPDGSRLVAYSQMDNKAAVFDVQNGGLVFEFSTGGGYSNHIRLALLTDADTLLTLDADSLKMTDLVSGKEILCRTLEDWPGGGLFTAGNGKIGKKVEVGGGYLNPYALDAEHSLLAMLSIDGSGSLVILNYESGKTVRFTLPGPGFGLDSGCFSPDGSVFAFEAAQTVFLLDVESGEEIKRSASGINDETYTMNTVYMNLSDGTTLERKYDTRVACTSLALMGWQSYYSPDGSKIMLHTDKHITVYDAESLEMVYEIYLDDDHTGGELRFVDGGRYFYSTANDSALYSTDTGETVRDLSREGLSIVAAANSGTQLIMDSGSMSLGVHNMIGEGSQRYVESYEGLLLKIVSSGPKKGAPEPVNNDNDRALGIEAGLYPEKTYYSPDGRFAVLANSGAFLKIWDLDVSGEVLYRCYENSIGSNCLCPDIAFSADSHYFASAGYDGRCVIFDLYEGKTVKVLAPCAANASKTAVTTYSDGSTKIEYLGELSKGSAVLGGVCFNEDASMVMLATEKTGEFFVYDIESGTLLYHLYADKKVRDFGFELKTGNAVVRYADGSALLATIFSDDATLLEYAQSLK